MVANAYYVGTGQSLHTAQKHAGGDQVGCTFLDTSIRRKPVRGMATSWGERHRRRDVDLVVVHAEQPGNAQPVERAREVALAHQFRATVAEAIILRRVQCGGEGAAGDQQPHTSRGTAFETEQHGRPASV